uniref:G domain-containing protein n=1 Tax=Phlebotomus papatasi TaxID=29031 RepID=A0A1B0DRC1_PHLPP
MDLSGMPQDSNSCQGSSSGWPNGRRLREMVFSKLVLFRKSQEVSSNSPIFVLDTPGVLTPYITDNETGIKLTLWLSAGSLGLLLQASRALDYNIDEK